MNRETAYTLGFLFADGNLTKDRVSVECKTEDINCLKNTLFSYLNWNIYNRQRERNGVLCQNTTILYKGNRKLSYELSSNGYGVKRDGELAINYIDKNLLNLWFRGYVDGDGCLYHNKEVNQLTIAGPKEFNWNFLTSRFSYFKICQNTGSKARISSLKNITIFMNYLYPDGYDGIGLLRKYSVYESMLNNRKRILNV